MWCLLFTYTGPSVITELKGYSYSLYQEEIEVIHVFMEGGGEQPKITSTCNAVNKSITMVHNCKHEEQDCTDQPKVWKVEPLIGHVHVHVGVCVPSYV